MKFKKFIQEENDMSLKMLGISKLVDGLSLKDIQTNPNWHWVIMAGISDAVLGKKGNKLVWHSGKWVLGTFDENFAIWKKGDWRGGLDSLGNVHKVGDSPNKW